MDKHTLFDYIRKGLIVSCQALEDEPLHSSFVMGKMALAAQQGGASAIRANTKPDIIEIKNNVSIPVVGIVKKDYPDSEIFITPTMKEIVELVSSGCEMIALDATDRPRPLKTELSAFVNEIKLKYPRVLLMADISTVDEAVAAERLGFDCVSTTLIGYTPYTAETLVYDNDFQPLKEILSSVKIPVIAEGNILTPEMAKRCIDLGAFAVVVGGAITRPQLITRRFTDALSE